MVEVQGGRGGALEPHLSLLGAGVNTGAALDQKRREMLSTNLREHREEIGRATVCNPGLLSVENVLVAVGREIRTCPRGERVRPGLRFGEREGGDDFARRKTRQILLPLLVGAVVDERHGAEAAVAEVPAEVRRILSQMLNRQHHRRQVERQTAKSLRDLHRRQTEGPGLSKQATRGVVVVPIKRLE